MSFAAFRKAKSDEFGYQIENVLDCVSATKRLNSLITEGEKVFDTMYGTDMANIAEKIKIQQPLLESIYDVVEGVYQRLSESLIHGYAVRWGYPFSKGAKCVRVYGPGSGGRLTLRVMTGDDTTAYPEALIGANQFSAGDTVVIILQDKTYAKDFDGATTYYNVYSVTDSIITLTTTTSGGIVDKYFGGAYVARVA